MRDVYPQRDVNSRTRGPAITAAGDGLSGVYSAVLHTVPSGGSCKVLVPTLSLTHYYTAECPSYAGGSVGDAVLVAFDQNKQPWLLPQALSFTAQPFRAYRAAAFSVLANAWTQVSLDTVQIGSAGQIVSGRYQVPSAGTYFVAANPTFGVTANPTNLYISSFISCNGDAPGAGATAKQIGGTAEDLQFTGTSAGSFQLPVSGFLQLTAGDTIGMLLFTSVGFALAIAPYTNTMSVMRVA